MKYSPGPDWAGAVFHSEGHRKEKQQDIAIFSGVCYDEKNKKRSGLR